LNVGLLVWGFLVPGLGAALITLFLYPALIAGLRLWKSGQVIQAELPDTHQAKAGTPTGGGVLFIAAAVIAGLVALATGHTSALPPMAGLVAGGLIGFADDRTKLRRGARGIPARLKLPIQTLFALPVAAIAMFEGGSHQLLLGSNPWIVFPIAVVAIVTAANAVNITDGMDGLAAGLSVIAIGGIVVMRGTLGMGELITAMALAGGLIAFLQFNRYPARVFMGDTGALAIGYALAAMAVQQGMLVLLPLVGLVFLLETLSVIIQVAYFKVSGGRRVFTMTPIHYTFHHKGWSENRIALSFWGAGLVSALAAAGVARLVS
jgi:phospho-N-acetylmuramoyl-pentapeptide-transferase